MNALSPPADVPEAVWRDFLAIRAAKRSPLTETALANIEREARSAGVSLTTALETCCANGWAGFQADWYVKRNTSGQNPRAPHAHFNRQVALEESNRAIARSFNEEMERRNAAKHN